MSFGFSVGDFLSATALYTNALPSLVAAQEDPNQDSVIIPSFRSLQAQRIKELQEELLRKSQDKLSALSSTDPDGLRAINESLDVLLNDYGRSAILPIHRK